MIQAHIAIVSKYIRESKEGCGDSSTAKEYAEKSFNEICEHIRKMSDEIAGLQNKLLEMMDKRK